MVGQQYRDYGDAEPVTLDRPLWKVPNKTRALFLGLGSRNLRQGGGTSHGARRPVGRTDGGLRRAPWDGPTEVLSPLCPQMRATCPNGEWAQYQHFSRHVRVLVPLTSHQLAFFFSFLY
jgi:hypothetical protein